MLLAFLIFLLTVSSRDAEKSIPDYLLELHKSCNLKKFIPKDAFKAEIYTTDRIIGSVSFLKYTVNLQNNRIKLHNTTPEENVVAFWTPTDLKTSTLSFSSAQKQDEKQTFVDQLIVTSTFVDVLYPNNIVEREFYDKQGALPGKLSTKLVYSYRLDTNTLYGFKRENGAIKCYQWTNYESLRITLPAKRLCPEGKNFPMHPPRVTMFDFATLLYATGCLGHIWEEFVYKKPPPAWIRFIKFEPVHRTTTPSTGLSSSKELSTTTESEDEEPPVEENKIPSFVLPLLGVLLVLAIIGVIVCFLWIRRIRKKQKGNTHKTTLQKVIYTLGSKDKKTKMDTQSRTESLSNSIHTTTANESSMQTINPIPLETIAEYLEEPQKQDKLFDPNEVEGLEAELPHKKLEGKPMPKDGLFTVFQKVGVTLPAGVFKDTFGYIDFNLSQERCTLQYEYVTYGLNRIETTALMMEHSQKYQKHGTIQAHICTVLLKEMGVRLLIAGKLGPSIEGDVCHGKLKFKERLDLVLGTLNCMEDLLTCQLIHRDIKSASFHYGLDSSKIYITHFGLARFHSPTKRLKVPFFGNLVFASLASHLKLERTYYDDMTSWFYMVMFIFNKDLLVWSVENDNIRVYNLKSQLLDEAVLDENLKTFVKDSKTREFLGQLYPLVLKLGDKEEASYKRICAFVERFTVR